MPDTEPLIAFLVATAIFAYVPGPAILYAAAQTIAGGRRAGFQAAAGLHVGGYVNVIAAAFGLAALFSAVPTLYLVLKFSGAAYLVYLGVGLMRRDMATVSQSPTESLKAPARTFWQSATVEILNPKSALFYVAFLPQFVDQSAALPLWAQFLVLGTIVNLMFSSADILFVLLADKVTKTFRNSSAVGQITNRIAGLALVGLGASLIADR